MSFVGDLFRRSPRWDAVTYWALDMETEGLDARRDAILSIGMVPVRGGVIRVGESFQSLVRPPEERPPEAAAIGAHHLRPIDTRDAPELRHVLPEVAFRIAEGALLVHHAPIDMAFLRRAFDAHGLTWSRPPVVDTVRLLYRLAGWERLLGDRTEEPELNMSAARAQMGLPSYPQHDALTDAIAAAELFLVLRARLGARRLGQLAFGGQRPRKSALALAARPM